MQSRKLKCFILLSIASLFGLAYRVYDRYREIQEFFANPEDLVWASKYLDKTINLCASPWETTVIIKSGGKDVYVSPGGRYELKWGNRYSEDAYFLIAKNVHSTENSMILSRYPDAQWAMGERFLIFSPAITKDQWWISPKVFISDTTTGKTIYFGKSEFYECEMENLN